MLPFGIGFSEILLILVVILLVVGPHKLPDMAKTFAKGLRTVRNAGRELRDAMDVEEVRDIKRSIYNPMQNDWRDEWPDDEPVDDVEIKDVEIKPKAETLHQKPGDTPAADEPAEPPLEEGPVARDPMSVVKPVEDDAEPGEPEPPKDP